MNEERGYITDDMNIPYSSDEESDDRVAERGRDKLNKSLNEVRTTLDTCVLSDNNTTGLFVDALVEVSLDNAETSAEAVVCAGVRTLSHWHYA